MQRIIIVYNPNSTNYKRVRTEVLSRARGLHGYVVGKYAVGKIGFDENVKRLARMLADDDVVIAAGGDATAAIAANAIMNSKKDAALAVLPYGNFNDLARTLGTMRVDDVLVPAGSGHFKVPLRFRKMYPLEIYVDGEFFRYATCYVTMGMTAEAVELFDEPKFRKYMQKGHKSSWRSYLALAKWYFKNRKKKVFVPEFRLNGRAVKPGVSDYCALSGKSMCRVMKGGDDFLKPRVFRSENCRLTSFPRLFMLMMRSILVRTPGSETVGDTLEFVAPATVEMQAEGEYRVFRDIREIKVIKSDRPLKVYCKP